MREGGRERENVQLIFHDYKALFNGIERETTVFKSNVSHLFGYSQCRKK